MVSSAIAGFLMVRLEMDSFSDLSSAVRERGGLLNDQLFGDSSAAGSRLCRRNRHAYLKEVFLCQ